MEIKVKVLNVGDGDAIIIALKESVAQQLVILIDGGHAGDADNVIKKLNPVLKAANKKGPDLIICTHYDADHIGGLKKIAQQYLKNIGEVWIHQPAIRMQASQLLKEAVLKKAELSSKSLAPQITLFQKKVTKKGLTEQVDIVVKSHAQMEELVDFLTRNNIKTVEPFFTQTIKGWPELKVLGPTKKFYNSLFNKTVLPEDFLLSEATAVKNEQLLLANKQFKVAAAPVINPCKFLDDQKKNKVTEVNQASVILQITIAGKKFLFTGDASLESFENIPKYPASLKNIFWFKVAHHGSHNNSSSKLFDIMKPVHAYISGGTQYLDNEVRDCLKAKGATVRNTRDEKSDLDFSFADA